MTDSLSNLLKNHLAEVLKQYFKPDDFFVLGVSGGPDSMALMHLLYKLEVPALIVHVNYGKRGEESDLDQELTEQLAFEWGFECCTIPLNPEDAGDENFQNWAREQRYRFFMDLKDEYEATAILTAHHQDDQVETILQKILRGSSPTAWQGMQVWDGELFRPLLPFSKQQILDYCEAETVPYRIDESNLENDYARNFLRHDFSEQMDRFFPGWQENILALQKQGERFEAAMKLIAEEIVEENKIDINRFSAIPPVLKTAILKTILDQAGLRGEYSKGQLQQLAELEHLQTGKNIEVGNLSLMRDRDYIVIHPTQEQQAVSEKISRSQAEKGQISAGLYFVCSPRRQQKAPLTLDADKLEWPLTLRNWEEGDRLTPLGMSGSQKVSRHLTFRKIPAHLKQKALVLCGSDSTIYAIIYPVNAENGEWGAIAEHVRYQAKTTTFLTININTV